MKKTRKAVSVLLCMLMVLAMFAPLHVVSFAEGETEPPAQPEATILETDNCGTDGSDVRYTLYSDGTLKVEGMGAIRDGAFENRSDLKTAVVEEGITAIGKNAFANTALETIDLPASLTVIDEGAFRSCAELTAVTGAEAMEEIRDEAFYNDRKLQAIAFPETLRIIGARAFWYNYKLYLALDGSTLHLSENFERLGYDAFIYTYIGELVAWNPNMIFDGQSNTPPYFCVHGYGGSTAETFAKGHLRLFYNIETDHCYWNGSTILEEATCETTGQKVSVCVICGYENYETIPLLEHDWVIVKNATETQPGTARTVCNRNPDHIRTIEFPAHGPATEVGYVGKDGDDVFYAMYEDGTLLVFGAGEVREQAFREKLFRVNDVIIDEGITAIGRLAFSGRIGIGGSIQLPDSLKSIGAGAFADHCVTSVKFGNGLETIGSGAFSTVFTGSGSQKTIVLPDSVKTVENNAFAYCDGLEEITFGPNVETVGTQVLYCGFILKKAVFLNGNTTLAYDMAVYTPDDFTIYSYAGGSVEAFANQYGYPFVDIGTYHEYDDGVITTPATCNTPGVKTYTCALCRDTYTEDIPATGEHTYDDGVITIPATCEADGMKTFTCAGCGGSYTETIPATGHDWSDWIVTRPATETREGEAYRFCKNDPSHVEHMTIDKLPTSYEEEQSLGDRIMDWLRDFFNKIGEFFQSLFIFW